MVQDEKGCERMVGGCTNPPQSLDNELNELGEPSSSHLGRITNTLQSVFLHSTNPKAVKLSPSHFANNRTANNGPLRKNKREYVPNT